MRAFVAVVLFGMALAGAEACADSAPTTFTVAAGPALLVGDYSAALGHVRLGLEAVPDRGVGYGVDAGWLSALWPPVYGVGTLSPSLILPLGSARTSLRAGYTLALSGGPIHLLHAGLAFDRPAGSGRRIRVEVQDSMLLGEPRAHVVEVAVGIAFDGR